MGSAVGWPRDRRVDERWPFGANLRWQCGRLWAGLRSSLGNMISWNTNEIQSRGGLPLVPNSGLGAGRGTRLVAQAKFGTVLFLLHYASRSAIAAQRHRYSRKFILRKYESSRAVILDITKSSSKNFIFI